MNYNHHNCFCHWCGTWVYAGDGIYHNFNGGFTLCVKCNTERNHKMANIRRRKERESEQKKHQPSLFD